MALSQIIMARKAVFKDVFSIHNSVMAFFRVCGSFRLDSFGSEVLADKLDQ
jgi:hypothetical protein